MRCIEILMLDCGLRRKEVININMRCIEIKYLQIKKTDKKININMRCIEIPGNIVQHVSVI